MTTEIITDIQISQLFPSPLNPRDGVGEESIIDEMAASLRSQGLLQPLLVVPHPGREGDYEVLIGHRRLAAAKRLGWSSLGCKIAEEMPDSEKLSIMLVENTQRSDLTPVEEGKGYQGLLDYPDFNIAHVVKKVGKSESTVRSRIKMLEAGEEALTAYKSGDLDLIHLAEISKYAGEDDLVAELTEAGMKAGSTEDWSWKSAQRRVAETFAWRTNAPKVYDHLVKLGYNFLEAEEATGPAFVRRYVHELPGLSESPEDLLGLTNFTISQSILDEHGKDGLRPYLNNTSHRVEWYTPAPVKEEAKKPELTPEEIAEREAREKVKLALRVEHPKFKEHLEALAGQPGKLKGTAHGALVEVICNIGYDLPDMLTLLGIDFDSAEPNKGDVYRDAIAAKSLDQLAYALFMVRIINIGGTGTNSLYDLGNFNPGGYGRFINHKIDALETIYGIEPSDAIKQAQAYWEPALPGTETETASAGVVDDEVSF